MATTSQAKFLKRKNRILKILSFLLGFSIFDRIGSIMEWKLGGVLLLNLMENRLVCVLNGFHD